MYPSRIVCLTEETTETLYLLGQGDRVVGVSGYTVRPPEARRKPRISSYLHARFDAIEALSPDLVLAFSDLQAELVMELVKRGLPVFTFNQRSVDGILEMIRVLGGIVGASTQAEALASGYERDLAAMRAATAAWPWRPRVYFEEWDDPLLSGIQWVEELVEIAGGTPVFPDLRHAGLGRDRIVASARVVGAAPEVIVGSWCGKPVRVARIAGRPGWEAIPAVREGRIFEIKSAHILQPGPAALTDGVRQLHAILTSVTAARDSPGRS
jgi:iron complex transport system substrate-binding protein